MFISRLSKIIALSGMLFAGIDAGAMLKIAPQFGHFAPNLFGKNFSTTPLYKQIPGNFPPFSKQVEDEMMRKTKEIYDLKQEKKETEQKSEERRKLTKRVFSDIKKKNAAKDAKVENKHAEEINRIVKTLIDPGVFVDYRKILAELEKLKASNLQDKQEIERLTYESQEKNWKIDELATKSEEKSKKIAELKKLEVSTFWNEQKIEELTDTLQKFGWKYDELKNEYDADISNKDANQEKISNAYEKKVANLVNAFKKTIEKLEKKYEKELKKITDALGAANKTIAALKTEKPSWWSRFLEGRKWKGEAKKQQKENENLKKEQKHRQDLTIEVLKKNKEKQNKLNLENADLKLKIENLEKEKKMLEEMLELAKQYPKQYKEALENLEGFNKSKRDLLELTYKNKIEKLAQEIKDKEQEIEKQKQEIEKQKQEIGKQKQEIEKPTQNQKNKEKQQQYSGWWDKAKWCMYTGLLSAATAVITYWYSHTPEQLEKYDRETLAPALQRKIENTFANKDLDGLKQIFADKRNQKLYEYLNREELAKKALESDFIDGLKFLLEEKIVQIVDLGEMQTVKIKVAGKTLDPFNKFEIINNLYHYAQTTTTLKFLDDQIEQLNSKITAYNTTHKDWVQKVPVDKAVILNTLVLVPDQNGPHLKTALDFYTERNNSELIEAAKKLGAKTSAAVLTEIQPYKQADLTKLTPRDVVSLNHFELALHKKLLPPPVIQQPK